MSYRGRILIINNLVASSLWHKLTCIDPPLCLLAEIRVKLHWVPRSVLFLPREERGQGFIHLQSRTAAFRLHFLQRLLNGSVTFSWKVVARKILRKFENGQLNFNGMPMFYWKCGICTKCREKKILSVYWLLEELLEHASI